MSPSSSRTHPHRVPSPPESRPPARREKVLDAALALIAERGVAGASLRELAARLEMSQPSLYHYFESKDDLVQQIVARCAHEMLLPAASGTMPKDRTELPRFIANVVIDMWSGERHPRFLRFLFAVAAEAPERRAIIRRTLEERLNPAFEMVARGFTETEAEVKELAQLLRMVTYAIAFPLLEERAILGLQKPSERVLEYAEWVVQAAERLLQSAPPPGLTKSGQRATRRARRR